MPSPPRWSETPTRRSLGLRRRAGSVQLTWQHGGDGTPGTQLVDGLQPGATQSVRVDALDTDVTVTTIASPPGAETCRIATINDLHIGCEYFGFRGGMKDSRRPYPMPFAARAAPSATRSAWGAQLLIVKGDLTHHATPEEWATVGDLLAGLQVPVAVIPGNHDVKEARLVEPQPALASHGLHLVHGVEVIDMPGIRVVLADTAVPDEHRGRVAHLAPDVVRVVSRAAGGVLVALHHHPQRYRYPTFLPPGIPDPSRIACFATLAAAHPATLVATGHSPPPSPISTGWHHGHRGRVDEGLSRHVGRLRGARRRNPSGGAQDQRPDLSAMAGSHRVVPAVASGACGRRASWTIAASHSPGEVAPSTANVGAMRGYGPAIDPEFVTRRRPTERTAPGTT